MLTKLAAIPPLLIAILLVLGWIAIAATRFRAPMLVDLAAIGLYAARPSLGTLALVATQVAVRYVPELARELALLLRLSSLAGWTRAFALLLLPGLARYALAEVSASIVEAPAELAPTPNSQPLTPEPLLINEWLHLLNHDATAPMVGVIGATRLGKTTLVLVLLSYRPGSFVITTPKARSTDPWGGFEAVRLRMDLQRRGVDWGPIAQAIGAVHFEMIRRNALDTIADEQPITLVIDELTTTLAAVPSLTPKVIDLWTMGASAKVFLIVIATDVNVRGWRIEGRRDVVDNLVFAKVEPGRHWSLGRIDPNGRLIVPRRMDTRMLLGLAERVDLRQRRWSGLQAGGEGQTEAGAAAAQETSQTAAAAADPATTIPLDPATRPPAPDRVYDDLIRAGLSRAVGAVALHRMGYGIDTNRWRDRRQALGLGREPRASRPTRGRSS